MKDPIAPVVVSQLSCLAAFGVSPAWYLRHANAGAFPCRRAGKLVLALPSDFIAFLLSLPPASRDGAGEDDLDKLLGTRKTG